jgi:hypothetical protein
MTSSTHIPLDYDDNGIRMMQTGAERRLPCGRTVQMHTPNPEWMAELLAKLGDVAEVRNG